MGTSSDGERYALIFKLTDGAPRFLAVTEDRLVNWRSDDWFVLARDSDIPDIQIDDVRRDDEKGRR
jgi:hypothetical protein